MKNMFLNLYGHIREFVFAIIVMTTAFTGANTISDKLKPAAPPPPKSMAVIQSPCTSEKIYVLGPDFHACLPRSSIDFTPLP